MLQTSGPVVQLRNIARSLGLTRVLSRFRNSSTYEERFGKAMLEAIRPGDVVWDVGANIGFYTEQFSTRVGESGQVVAFEPVPACYDKLAACVAGRRNVRLVKAGLGRTAGTVTFDIGSSDETLGRVVEGNSASANAKLVQLPIHVGDELAVRESIPGPTYVKVDVEGHELDVLRGMSGLLRSPACKNVFVEIHFGILSKRGQPGAPDEIVRLLSGMGYKIGWVDSSHIHASRG
jgi:FkbM family methyltransferase